MVGVVVAEAVVDTAGAEAATVAAAVVAVEEAALRVLALRVVPSCHRDRETVVASIVVVEAVAVAVVMVDVDVDVAVVAAGTAMVIRPRERGCSDTVGGTADAAAWRSGVDRGVVFLVRHASVQCMNVPCESCVTKWVWETQSGVTRTREADCSSKRHRSHVTSE